jgi:predicted GIY-YIG superfamily endonuclease
MRFWVYIVRCADGSYYTGHSDDLERRIAAHQSGEIKSYTSTRLPIELVYSQEFVTRIEALEHERQIKGWSRKKKEALMRGDWEEISRLARKN